MPYSSTKDLPDQVRNALPSHAQDIFLAAFNSAFHGACTDRENREQCAMEIAWAAVKKSYHKQGDSWVANESAKPVEYEPPQSPDNAPEGLKKILQAAYQSCREQNPGEDPAQKEKCSKIAWAAVKHKYRQDEQGDWQLIQKESGDVTDSEFIETNRLPVKARFVRSDGTARVRIISPGWGSSGYYSREVLQRDGPRIYTPGTRMFLDHPTMREEKERPERSLRDMVAVITGNATFEAPGTPDEGVYAEVEVFRPFREYLNEIAPYIGVSHRASGTARTGSAEGRSGKIIESLTSCQSVDFVTAPGRGGGVVPLFEAWRAEHAQTGDQEPFVEHSPQGGDTMGDNTVITKESLRKTAPLIYNEIRDEVLREVAASNETKLKEAEHATALKENKELKDEVARLREAQVLVEAAGLVLKALEKVDLPAVTKERLQESLPKLATIKDNKLDVVAFAETVKKSVAEETAYVAKIRGAGKVTGLGGGTGSGTSLEESQKKLVESFRSLGMTEEQAKIAAAGRV